MSLKEQVDRKLKFQIELCGDANGERNTPEYYEMMAVDMIRCNQMSEVYNGSRLNERR